MRKERNLNMRELFKYLLLPLLLLTGFFLLLLRLKILKAVKLMLMKAKVSIEDKDRETKLLQRKNLGEFEKKNTFYLMVERQIEYSGLRRRFENLTAGKLIVFNVVPTSALYALGLFLFGFKAGLFMALGYALTGVVFTEYLKSKNLKATGEQLPGLLDFLGNYSLTGSELISIFSQISRYVDEPLRSVMQECEMEARITGDSYLALESMAEKNEHPQFKLLVRNISVTARYGGDFNLLVTESRKSLREYLSQAADRKGMVTEAAINMILLLAMSVIVLAVVNLMIGGGIMQVLLGTFVGHLSITGMIVIFILFIYQIFSLYK